MRKEYSESVISDTLAILSDERSMRTCLDGFDDDKRIFDRNPPSYGSTPLIPEPKDNIFAKLDEMRYIDPDDETQMNQSLQTISDAITTLQIEQVKTQHMVDEGIKELSKDTPVNFGIQLEKLDHKMNLLKESIRMLEEAGNRRYEEQRRDSVKSEFSFGQASPLENNEQQEQIRLLNEMKKDQYMLFENFKNLQANYFQQQSTELLRIYDKLQQGVSYSAPSYNIDNSEIVQLLQDMKEEQGKTLNESLSSQGEILKKLEDKLLDPKGTVFENKETEERRQKEFDVLRNYFRAVLWILLITLMFLVVSILGIFQ